MTTLRRARDRMPDAALVCMDLRGTRAHRAAAPAECYIVYRRLKPCVRTVCGERLNCRQTKLHIALSRVAAASD